MDVVHVGSGIIEPLQGSDNFCGHSAAVVELTLFRLHVLRDTGNKGQSLECSSHFSSRQRDQGLSHIKVPWGMGWWAAGARSLEWHMFESPLWDWVSKPGEKIHQSLPNKSSVRWYQDLEANAQEHGVENRNMKGETAGGGGMALARSAGLPHLPCEMVRTVPLRFSKPQSVKTLWTPPGFDNSLYCSDGLPILRGWVTVHFSVRSYFAYLCRGPNVSLFKNIPTKRTNLLYCCLKIFK